MDNEADLGYESKRRKIGTNPTIKADNEKSMKSNQNWIDTDRW
jgi:hypothetical protein